MLKHFFTSFCLKYLVPTISVISVMDLWSVIIIYKKRGCRNTGAIFQYVPGKTIITRCSDLILHKIRIQYQWCKNNVDPKSVSLKTVPGITIWQRHGYRLDIQVWSVISVTAGKLIIRSRPSLKHQFSMWFIWEKIISDNQRAKHVYPF